MPSNKNVAPPKADVGTTPTTNAGTTATTTTSTTTPSAISSLSRNSYQPAPVTTSSTVITPTSNGPTPAQIMALTTALLGGNKNGAGNGAAGANGSPGSFGGSSGSGIGSGGTQVASLDPGSFSGSARGNVLSDATESDFPMAPVASISGCGNSHRTTVTHYGSDPTRYASLAEANMEGGEFDRWGKDPKKNKLNSVEEAIKNKRPVSLAGDTKGGFGKRCNSRNSACLMLVCYPSFDKNYPNYRRTFPNVPKNCMIGAVVDTGSAFTHKGGTKLDVATKDIQIARSLKETGEWTELQSPNCKGGAGVVRACDVSKLEINCGKYAGGTPPAGATAPADTARAPATGGTQ